MMKKSGNILFWAGLVLAVAMGLVASIDPGYVCRLSNILSVNSVSL